MKKCTYCNKENDDCAIRCWNCDGALNFLGVIAILKWKILLILVVISAISYGLWKSEIFQREVFPRKYWSKQVEDLEHTIKLYEYMFKDASIELRKKRITAGLELEQETNKAINLLGMDPKEARQEALNQAQDSIVELEDSLNFWKEELNQIRQKLEKAKREFGKHK